MSPPRTPEHQRLAEAGVPNSHWRRWGPYVSDRAWGTVREDYSADGTAWDYFPHDHARSRAYRWNEDGIAGLCDRRQEFCLALALWNGRDPILKERFFGLTGTEGNHGEDVKEYYFYLDSTPTHSYMRMLYKYPQRAYPYADLVATNGRRTAAGAGVRTHRHRDLRRPPLLRRGRRVRQGRHRRRADADHRGQSRPGGGLAPRAADRVVPQHLVMVGRRGAPVPARAAHPSAPHPSSRPTRRPTARATSTSRARRRCCSPRTTPTRGSCSAVDGPPYAKDGINDHVVDGRQGRHQSRRTRHQGCRPLRPRRASRRRDGGAGALHHRRARAGRPLRRLRRRAAPHAGPTPTPSTRRSSRTTSRPTPRR